MGHHVAEVRSMRLVIVIGVIALMAASGLSPAGKAKASTSTTLAASTWYNSTGQLNGVAASSADNAWAVGEDGQGYGKAILLHWNGRTWRRVSIPEGFYSELSAVTAVSATDVWAVGAFESTANSTIGTLILHWDGRTWRRVTNVPGYGATAVAATSHDVWVANITLHEDEFLHLTGGHWYVVPITQPSGLNFDIDAMTLVSPTLGWAGGTYHDNQGNQHDFLMQWKGSVWKPVPSPMTGWSINGMASGPGGIAWAVGEGNPASISISMRWNGKNWQVVPGPAGGFFAVGFIPGGTAWAVGNTAAGNALTAHWTGSAWKSIAAPTPCGNLLLYGIAATSNHDAWTVGLCLTPNNVNSTLMLHWNGKTWS